NNLTNKVIVQGNKNDGALKSIQQQLNSLNQRVTKLEHTNPPPPPQSLGSPVSTRLAVTDPVDLPKTQSPTSTSFPQPPYAKKTLSATDFVLQNPAGDTGLLSIERVRADGTVVTLLVEALENFRELDFHFVAPLTFTRGEQLRLEVTCANTPPPDNP